MRKPAVRAGSDGYISAVAIFALAIMGVMVVGGYVTSRQQLHAGRSALKANAALYTAEAGLGVALSSSNNRKLDGLGPGATLALDPGRLTWTDGYEVWATRLDAGQDRRTAYYLITSTGRAGGPSAGRRTLALVTSARRFDDVCCEAALGVSGSVEVSASSKVSGRDSVPPSWHTPEGPCRGIELADVPGLAMRDSALVSLVEDSTVRGEPAVAEIESGSWELAYIEMVGYAELEYADGALVGRAESAPREYDDCAPDWAGDWGAPLDQNHECFDYYPVIHVAGDLSIDFSGNGQGVLLVDGNFDLGSGYEFYGVVVVRGAIRTVDRGGRIYGGVLAINAGPVGNSIGGDALIQYSSCAVRRAMVHSKLGAPRPLAQRGWLELLK